MRPTDAREPWPELPYAALKPTLDTLQLWTQIVGKVRLANTPWVNHGWHVTLYPSSRGLTTGLIAHGPAGLELEFDFFSDALEVRTTEGATRRIRLAAGPVSTFYAEVLEALSSVGAAATIDPRPNELEDATPFAEDHRPRAYDPEAARCYWRALVQVERVFQRFRTRFIGKCSPVHLFWGALDLAVTRFSGRRAPLHPGGVPHLPDAVTREAYSHEVSSAGFWPGGGAVEEACFYSYAYPALPGFAQVRVKPETARFEASLGEFVLPYAAVRAAPDPDAALLGFLQSTYEAAADLGGWEREALDIPEGVVGRPRSLD